MNCKFYSDYIEGAGECCCSYDRVNYNGPILLCTHKGEEDNCTCFEEPKEKIKKRPITTEDMITPAQLRAIMSPKYSAKISIGDWEINLTNKTFTEKQIKNMKEMLGWEVKNL